MIVLKELGLLLLVLIKIIQSPLPIVDVRQFAIAHEKLLLFCSLHGIVGGSSLGETV